MNHEHRNRETKCERVLRFDERSLRFCAISNSQAPPNYSFWYALSSRIVFFRKTGLGSIRDWNDSNAIKYGLVANIRWELSKSRKAASFTGRVWNNSSFGAKRRINKCEINSILTMVFIAPFKSKLLCPGFTNHAHARRRAYVTRKKCVRHCIYVTFAQCLSARWT